MARRRGGRKPRCRRYEGGKGGSSSALAGLGSIYLETGKEQDALVALEKALAVDPHLWSVRMRVDQLKKKLLGTPI